MKPDLKCKFFLVWHLAFDTDSCPSWGSHRIFSQSKHFARTFLDEHGGVSGANWRNSTPGRGWSNAVASTVFSVSCCNCLLLRDYALSCVPPCCKSYRLTCSDYFSTSNLRAFLATNSISNCEKHVSWVQAERMEIAALYCRDSVTYRLVSPTK